MDKEPGLAYLVTPAAEVKKPDRGAKTHWHLSGTLEGKGGIFIRDLDLQGEGVFCNNGGDFATPVPLQELQSRPVWLEKRGQGC